MYMNFRPLTDSIVTGIRAQTCGKVGIPCIPQDTGILAESEKAKAGVTTVNYVIIALFVVAFVGATIRAMSSLNDNEYKKAVGPVLSIVFAGVVGAIFIWVQRS